MNSQRPSDAPGGTVPEGRYGPSKASRRGRSRPVLRIVLIAVPLVLVLGPLTYLAYENLANDPIEADRTSFRELPDHSMELNMQVRRDEPDRAAVCIVRTRSVDGLETGRREVFVPPGKSQLETVVKGTSKPVTASIVGCDYDVPGYMSKAMRPTE